MIFASNKTENSMSIKVENVSYTYSGNSTKTLNNISVEVLKGSTLAIFGASGAGKSTLLNFITVNLQYK